MSRSPGRRTSASAAAESWFLERGLPSVLTRRDRWRRLWPRSAPMLAAYAALQGCILPVYLITGGHDVEITGEPTASELVVLVIIGVSLPLMALVGWLVSRSRSGRTRAVVVTGAMAVVASGRSSGSPVNWRRRRWSSSSCWGSPVAASVRWSDGRCA